MKGLLPRNYSISWEIEPSIVKSNRLKDQRFDKNALPLLELRESSTHSPQRCHRELLQSSEVLGCKSWKNLQRGLLATQRLHRVSCWICSAQRSQIRWVTKKISPENLKQIDGKYTVKFHFLLKLTLWEEQFSKQVMTGRKVIFTSLWYTMMKIQLFTVTVYNVCFAPINEHVCATIRATIYCYSMVHQEMIAEVGQSYFRFWLLYKLFMHRYMIPRSASRGLPLTVPGNCHQGALTGHFHRGLSSRDAEAKNYRRITTVYLRLAGWLSHSLYQSTNERIFSPQQLPLRALLDRRSNLQ